MQRQKDPAGKLELELEFPALPLKATSCYLDLYRDICIYIYIYLFIHIYVYIHIYIYIYMYKNKVYLPTSRFLWTDVKISRILELLHQDFQLGFVLVDTFSRLRRGSCQREPGGMSSKNKLCVLMFQRKNGDK